MLKKKKKLFDYGDRRTAIREMDICKQMEVLGGNGKVRVPRFIGVVHEELSARVIRLLLSWVDCENKTLECSLGPETPSTLRMK